MHKGCENCFSTTKARLQLEKKNTNPKIHFLFNIFSRTKPNLKINVFTIFFFPKPAFVPPTFQFTLHRSYVISSEVRFEQQSRESKANIRRVMSSVALMRILPLPDTW